MDFNERKLSIKKGFFKKNKKNKIKEDSNDNGTNGIIYTNNNGSEHSLNNKIKNSIYLEQYIKEEVANQIEFYKELHSNLVSNLNYENRNTQQKFTKMENIIHENNMLIKELKEKYSMAQENYKALMFQLATCEEEMQDNNAIIERQQTQIQNLLKQNKMYETKLEDMTKKLEKYDKKNKEMDKRLASHEQMITEYNQKRELETINDYAEEISSQIEKNQLPNVKFQTLVHDFLVKIENCEKQNDICVNKVNELLEKRSSEISDLKKIFDEMTLRLKFFGIKEYDEIVNSLQKLKEYITCPISELLNMDKLDLTMKNIYSLPSGISVLKNIKKL